MSVIVTVVGVTGFALVLTIFLASRSARIVLCLAPFLANVFGFLFVAPALLDAHHLVPATLADWRTVVIWLSAAFGVIGVILSFVPALALGTIDLILRRDGRDNAAAVLWCGAWLPVMYLAASSLVEWLNFSRPPAPVQRTLLLWLIATTIAVVSLASMLALRRQHRRLGFRLIAVYIGAAALTAISALPVQIHGLAKQVPFTLPPLKVANPTHPRPLLFIGLDGGDWRLLRPSMESGRAPHLASLVATGIHGTMKAEWPPYWSTPAWGAILTGHNRQDVGVYEDLAATIDGLPPFELPLTLDLLLNPIFVPEFMLIQQGVIEPTPVPRSRLKRVPVWERLTAEGRETAVVRLPFTYPAPRQANYMVSNRIVTDLWDQLSVEAGERSLLVAPEAEADRLMAWFSAEPVSDGRELASIRGGVGAPLKKPADSIVDLDEVLRKVLDIEQRMVKTTEDLVRRHPTLDVMMVHVTSLDSVCHAFWQYRFPEDFDERHRPDEADIRLLGPVVDRYVEYIDSQVGRLIAAFPATPNVVIVSDHGAQASDDYPMWKGWHGPRGIFIAAGPDIAHSPASSDVTYFDVVPTILELQGFHVPTDLKGRSLTGQPGY